MSLALPYYSGESNNDNLPSIEIPYDIDVYNKISSEITEYDFNEEAFSVLDKSLYIFGKNDYIEPKDIEILTRNNKCPIHYINGGHFSFAQDNEKFKKIVIEFFTHERY